MKRGATKHKNLRLSSAPTADSGVTYHPRPPAPSSAWVSTAAKSIHPIQPLSKLMANCYFPGAALAPSASPRFSSTRSLAEEHRAEQGEMLQRLSPRDVDAFSSCPPSSSLPQAP